MQALLRSLAVLFVAVAVFLVYAVIHAMASAGGARTWVAVGYIAGAIVLTALAVLMWRHKPPGGRHAAGGGTPHAA